MRRVWSGIMMAYMGMDGWWLLLVAYGLLVCIGLRLLHYLAAQSSHPNVMSYFVANCCLSNLVRLLQLILLTELGTARGVEFLNAQMAVDDDTQLFYLQKGAAILRDLPVYPLTSAYVLLVLLATDSLRTSRRHWMSLGRYRILMLKGFAGFNAAMYATQTAQYMIFIAGVYDRVSTVFHILILPRRH
jgi:hypothetical protein